jgi:hypothetical protein
MTENDDLRTPAPAWLTNEHIDQDKVSRLLAEYFEEHDPELFAEMMRGELRWTLGRPVPACFDDEGIVKVTVFRAATGEETTVEALSHWSAIVRADAEPS